MVIPLALPAKSGLSIWYFHDTLGLECMHTHPSAPKEGKAKYSMQNGIL